MFSCTSLSSSHFCRHCLDIPELVADIRPWDSQRVLVCVALYSNLVPVIFCSPFYSCIATTQAYKLVVLLDRGLLRAFYPLIITSLELVPNHSRDFYRPSTVASHPRPPGTMPFRTRDTELYRRDEKYGHKLLTPE